MPCTQASWDHNTSRLAILLCVSSCTAVVVGVNAVLALQVSVLPNTVHLPTKSTCPAVDQSGENVTHAAAMLRPVEVACFA